VVVVHDMELRVTVRLSDMTITESKATMHVFPHTECPGIVQAFAGLAGLSVTRGYTRAVQGLFGGPKGLHPSGAPGQVFGPVVIQAMTSKRALAVERGEAETIFEGTGSPFTRNTCHVWAEDGIAEQKLAAGWRPGQGQYPAPPLESSASRTPRHEHRRGPTGWVRRLRLSVPLVAIVVTGGVISACTSSGVAVSTPYATTPPVLQHGPKSEVKVENVSGLGPVLVDGQGITLYLFETDKQGSPSRCYDICAIQWPPQLLPKGVVAPIAGPGIEAKAAWNRSPHRRHDPDHLQRMAVVLLATRQAAGQGHRSGTDQCGWCLVCGQCGRQCRAHTVMTLAEG